MTRVTYAGAEIVYFFMKKSRMISVTSRHALRALTRLAVLPNGKTLLGKDLARESEIPPNYLSKILWALGSAGIIDAHRGSGGGYRLRKRAEEIRLIEVVSLFEKTRVPTPCFLAEERLCSEAHPCSAHVAWRDLAAAFNQFLESTTLADIAHHREPASSGKEIA